MTTREMITIAKSKGITIKKLSELTEISKSTLYHYYRGRNIIKEKEEKIRNIISFLFDLE